MIILGLDLAAASPPRRLPKLPAELIRERLHYEPATGQFTWKIARTNGIKPGDAAGCINSEGYVEISLDNRQYKGHRLAWVWMTGQWPEHEVDHVNLAKADNCWENLRAATSTQQRGNEGLKRHNTSGVKGVHFCNTCKKWMATIGINGRRKTLGRFATKELAAAAYEAAAIAHWGEFARVVR